MFSTGVLRMQVFEKAGDYEAFERVLKETLEEARCGCARTVGCPAIGIYSFGPSVMAIWQDSCNA